jgi:alpha-beta hydrolase superfamily lysophospholipase
LGREHDPIDAAGQMPGVRYRQWTVGDTHAVLLLVHGIGGHTGRWELLADFFLQRGIASYALALRGFGDTPGLKGHIDSFAIYYSDIESLSAIIRKEHPEKKIFLLGESLGGLLSFIMAIDKGHLFSGVICLSPAFADTLEVDTKTFWSIIFSSVFEPTRQFSMFDSLSCCSRDTELVKRLDADPREHWVASSRLLVETLVAELRAKRLKDKVSIPVLFLLGGHDTIVSTDESIRIFRSMKARDKTLKVYAEMLHALSIDLGREQVFEDILNWTSARL